jgi:hypothetical protein
MMTGGLPPLSMYPLLLFLPLKNMLLPTYKKKKKERKKERKKGHLDFVIVNITVVVF